MDVWRKGAERYWEGMPGAVGAALHRSEDGMRRNGRVVRPGSKREGTLAITGLERMGSVRRIRACTNSTRLSVSQLDFE